MKRAGGFTLLEIMLVLLLLGIASSLIMLRFPAPGGQLAQQGELLAWRLSEAAERAEREGKTYGVAFSDGGWRIVAEGERQGRDASSLPAGMALQLALERQNIALDAAWPPTEPQVWLYPGGETSVFTVTLLQGKCRWQLYASGFLAFETTAARCDES
ncbi:type II secretion system protein H [Serratia entomophila]|jgi:general secretion pathway protein H|uniref:Prepilin-type N-terminal cleavage/methylation domain-containing protein n=1 Tax=Serratia entomophila TaxID=42906 RepID=A0ABY5CWA8_9GAMM|nr:prepilin-type N-terminal cleavage/methylation domain-containing protein [Serratia entomophila]UIW19385.1 prepilin-type N-terminal cleavage/methylation domain-containing protein [Serratia entomophila]USV01972.1 prepilin-type N-terminal cleavage/methylation domain-containing protein [Serratia entomophila]CAI0713185.1 type II secretion system protein H [Serratia entomophila]CAI0771858.1 type II secretion system protein H [Serratia entomophila]CAI0784513.1 type II secretion system protein H [Se